MGLSALREGVHSFSTLPSTVYVIDITWALRAATSSVIAEKSVGRKEAAWKTLQATYGKFREGFDTFDLELARQVLNGSYSLVAEAARAPGSSCGKGFN